MNHRPQEGFPGDFSHSCFHLFSALYNCLDHRITLQCPIWSDNACRLLSSVLGFLGLSISTAVFVYKLFCVGVYGFPRDCSFATKY